MARSVLPNTRMVAAGQVEKEVPRCIYSRSRHHPWQDVARQRKAGRRAGHCQHGVFNDQETHDPGPAGPAYATIALAAFLLPETRGEVLAA